MITITTTTKSKAKQNKNDNNDDDGDNCKSTNQKKNILTSKNKSTVDTPPQKKEKKTDICKRPVNVLFRTHFSESYESYRTDRRRFTTIYQTHRHRKSGTTSGTGQKGGDSQLFIK